MRRFLNQPFLDNTVSSFLWPLIIILLVIIFRNFLSRIIARLVYAIIKRWTPGIERKDFVHLLLKPLAVFIAFLVFVASIDHLQYPHLLNFKINFLHTDMAGMLLGIKLIVLTILFFWVILRLVDFGALVFSHRANLVQQPSGNQIVFFFRDFIKVIIAFIGFLLIMKHIAGKDWTGKLIGAMGIGAAALALAAKDTIENLMGSFIILLDKPFRIGDYIKINDVAGNVEKVGLRSTRIRSDNKTFITIPNSQIINSILDDITLMTQRRVKILLELDPATLSSSVMNVLEDIQNLLRADVDVLDNFTLNFNDISNRAYAVQLIYYTQITEWQAYNALKQKINLEIIQAMENRNVKLAKNFDLKTGS
ncbi:MAG: mechanosensitive ion channel [Chitinophagaceae bacterium]|nr:MAG: mechanosensitive ion channel [Chitinophagaceae bacterium]